MNKTIKFIFGLCLLISTISCKQNPTVVAKIDGLGNDTIYVSIVPFSDLDDETKDTIIATNDRFVYNLSVQEPILLMFDSKKASYIRENGNNFRPWSKKILLALGPDDRVEINGKLLPFSLEYDAKGNTFNDDYSQFRKQFFNIQKKTIAIELKIDSLYFSEDDQQLVSQLFKERNSFSQKIKNVKLEYIKSNPDKDLSAFYLALSQPLDTLGLYFDSLDNKVRSGLFEDFLKYKKVEYQKYVLVREAEEKIVPGNAAPDFSLNTINQSSFSLSNLKGKYAVLDFWGSWCNPCIKGFPKMKEYYKKYKSKIEFVSIACNDKEDDWKNAVNKYELNWIQLFNNDSIDKDVSVMYSVMTYPTKVIIDPEGNIIQQFKGEGDDFYLKLDELLN